MEEGSREVLDAAMAQAAEAEEAQEACGPAGVWGVGGVGHGAVAGPIFVLNQALTAAKATALLAVAPSAWSPLCACFGACLSSA